MLTKEQRAKRKGLITSSIAAGCLGIDEHMSPLEAALRARGEYESSSSAATERGDELEELLIDYPLGRAHGIASVESAPFRAHENGWSGTSADAVYRDAKGGIIAVGEAKTVAMGGAAKYGEEMTDEIPYHTLIQALMHLEHWPEAEVCYVPVLVGGYQFEFRLYTVHRNQILMRSVMEELEEFHQAYVVGGHLPPPNELDSELMAKRYPIGDGDAIMDTPKIQALARAKDAASRTALEAKAAETDAKNKLKAILGTAQCVRGHWGFVSWRNRADIPKVDWPAIAVEAYGGDIPQELLCKHTTLHAGPRVMRVVIKGERDD